MPYRCARRTPRSLYRLRTDDRHLLQLVPKQALPKVPGKCPPPLAGGTSARVVAHPLCTRSLYSAAGTRSHCITEQTGDLRPALSLQRRNPARSGSRSQTSGRRDRFLQRAAHLGSEAPTEPSLMMPGIIISFVFSKQGWLVFRTTPLQNQLARADEPFDHTPNWLVVQICTTNPPGCARSDLLTLQQACLH